MKLDTTAATAVVQNPMNVDQRSPPTAEILLRCHFPNPLRKLRRIVRSSLFHSRVSIEAVRATATTISLLVTKLLRHHGANMPPASHSILAYLGPFTLTLHCKQKRQVATLNTHTRMHAPPLMLRRFRRYHMCTAITIIIDNVGLVRPTLDLRLNPKRTLILFLCRRCDRRRAGAVGGEAGQWRLERTRFPGRLRSEPT